VGLPLIAPLSQGLWRMCLSEGWLLKSMLTSACVVSRVSWCGNLSPHQTKGEDKAQALEKLKKAVDLRPDMKDTWLALAQARAACVCVCGCVSL
jgi:hypothetical protein